MPLPVCLDMCSAQFVVSLVISQYVALVFNCAFSRFEWNRGVVLDAVMLKGVEVSQTWLQLRTLNRFTALKKQGKLHWARLA